MVLSYEWRPAPVPSQVLLWQGQWQVGGWCYLRRAYFERQAPGQWREAEIPVDAPPLPRPSVANIQADEPPPVAVADSPPCAH